MLLEHGIRILHHLPQQRRVAPLREFPLHRPARNIVRRRQFGPLLCAAHHEALPVGYAGIDPAGSVRKALVDHIDQFPRLRRRDFARAVIEHRRLIDRACSGQRYKVAPIGHILRRKFDPDAGRFQWRASGIVHLRVIAKHGKVSRIAARFHALRNGAHHAEFSVLRQKIHCWMARRIQRRFPVQLRYGYIRHAVAKKHHILHR